MDRLDRLFNLVRELKGLDNILEQYLVQTEAEQSSVASPSTKFISL